MCAFNVALNFGRDMIELGVSTFGALVDIQLADLSTFFERQSDTLDKTAAVHDVAAFMVLQREYRDAFRADRGKALAATTGVLQEASRVAAKNWSGLVRGRLSSAVLAEGKPASEPPTRAPLVIEHHALPSNAPAPTKARRGDIHSKMRGNRRTKTDESPSASTKVGIGTTGSARHKTSVDAPATVTAAAAAAVDGGKPKVKKQRRGGPPPNTH